MNPQMDDLVIPGCSAFSSRLGIGTVTSIQGTTASFQTSDGRVHQVGVADLRRRRDPAKDAPKGKPEPYVRHLHCGECGGWIPEHEFRNPRAHPYERACKSCEARQGIAASRPGSATGRDSRAATRAELEPAVVAGEASAGGGAGVLVSLALVLVGILVVGMLVPLLFALLPVVMVLSVMIFGYFPERHR